MSNNIATFVSNHAVQTISFSEGLPIVRGFSNAPAIGRVAWQQYQVCLAAAFVICFPSVLLSGEPMMEVYVDYASMAFSGISPAMVKQIAKDSKLDNPESWPVYSTTGHKVYDLPESFIRHGEKHPEWDVKRLLEYRIAFRQYRQGDRANDPAQRVVFLYQPKGKILFVLYDDIPKKENDPKSPF